MAVDALHDSIASLDGVRFGADAQPWCPDEATRLGLRVHTAHIGAHPPVVGATPHEGHWPVTRIGPGVTVWWDPDRRRPRRWQQHVCRTALHARIDDRDAALAPTFVLLRGELWLVHGHHDLWLIVAARTSGLISGPVAAYLHLPGDRRLPAPELSCPCPHRPRFAPRRPLLLG